MKNIVLFLIAETNVTVQYLNLSPLSQENIFSSSINTLFEYGNYYCSTVLLILLPVRKEITIIIVNGRFNSNSNRKQNKTRSVIVRYLKIKIV